MVSALGVEAGVGIAQALVFGRRRREGGIDHIFIILKAHIQNSFLLPERNITIEFRGASLRASPASI